MLPMTIGVYNIMFNLIKTLQVAKKAALKGRFLAWTSKLTVY